MISLFFGAIWLLVKGIFALWAIWGILLVALNGIEAGPYYVKKSGEKVLELTLITYGILMEYLPKEMRGRVANFNRHLSIQYSLWRGWISPEVANELYKPESERNHAVFEKL